MFCILESFKQINMFCNIEPLNSTNVFHIFKLFVISRDMFVVVRETIVLFTNSQK